MELMTGALPSLITKLGDLLVGEYKLQKGVKGEIMFLQAELESMKVALEKLSEAPADQIDKQDKIWAREVRELSYDIEDSIDVFKMQAKGREPAKGLKKYSDRSLDLLTLFQLRHKIATEISDIKHRVKEVCERRDRYKVNGVPDNKPATVDPLLLAQYWKATELVGIDKARDEVIKMLIEGNEVSKQQGKIISIVGFGGLGKTTLANAVYEKLRGQFDCWAFVSVSQTPYMKKLFRRLLYDLGKKHIEQMWDEMQLINEIRKFLQEKRYFIVMDDIWTLSVWEVIRCAFPDNDCGYRIITTTRMFDIAIHAGIAYKLKPLSIQNSRILLYGRIFGNQHNDKCPDDELVEVSDRLLSKCAGVPLAIITIASLLASKAKNKVEWYNVCYSIGTGLEKSQDMEKMRKILSLSYYNLPSHLRTCLLYLSVFKEDLKIGKNHLISMWIAEGFIQHEKRENLFELGESYFNQLINSSMIQPVYDDMNSVMVEYCCVHDMVLDLLCSLSNEENFVTIFNNMGHEDRTKKVRRLSLQNSNIDDAMCWTHLSLQSVRSVVVFSAAPNLLVRSLPNLRVLRVLELHDCDLSKSCGLKYLGTLIHLRYLCLRMTRYKKLPVEIGKLQFLQTLDVSADNQFFPWRLSCTNSLPGTIVQLRNLMRLCIGENTRLPNGIGSLVSLEELSTLGIYDTTSIIEELGHLKKLRVLHIYCKIECNDNTLEKSLVESLSNLQEIQTLCIWAFGGEFNFDGGLGAPLHLRKLRLEGCWFSTLPDWMNSSLLDLSFLRISVRAIQQEDLEIIGSLPSLCYLDLKVDHLNLVIPEGFSIGTCSFPCLVKCELWGFKGPVVFLQGAMPKLTSIRFSFPVRETREIACSHRGFDLGLRNLRLIQDIAIYLQSGSSSTEEVDETKAVLMHAANTHPNQPTFRIYDWSS